MRLQKRGICWAASWCAGHYVGLPYTTGPVQLACSSGAGIFAADASAHSRRGQIQLLFLLWHVGLRPASSTLMQQSALSVLPLLSLAGLKGSQQGLNCSAEAAAPAQISGASSSCGLGNPRDCGAYSCCWRWSTESFGPICATD